MNILIMIMMTLKVINMVQRAITGYVDTLYMEEEDKRLSG